MQRARKFRPDRVLHRITLSVILWIIVLFQPLVVSSVFADVTFIASADTIDTYDFVEVTIKVDILPGAVIAKPRRGRPTTDEDWPGECTWPDATKRQASVLIPGQDGGRILEVDG